MAIALVTNTSGVGTATAATTGSVNTTGANLVVVAVVEQQGVTGALSDNKSNTWTPLTASEIAGGVGGKLYYSSSPTVGSGHTFTIGTSSAPTIYAQAFSGVSTSTPFDQQNGGTATGGTTVQPGSVTPSQNNELIVTMLGFNGAATPTSINSSFVKTDEQNFGAGNNYGGAMAYLIQTSLAAVNPTWTDSGSFSRVSRIATFKATAAVATATGATLQMMGV